jgi:novel plant SNARE
MLLLEMLICLTASNVTCTQTAATLGDQTNQMNKIVDDLNDIEFTMKKASKIIRDITRGIMTDK